MPISALHLTNLGPVDDVDFEFDPQVNVFVGPNNCGKTTVLLLLGHVLVPEAVVPNKLARQVKARFRLCHTAVDVRRGELKGTFPSTATSRPDAKKKIPKGTKEARQHLGYTAFVPALRCSTDYRSSGPTQHQKESSATGGAEDEEGNATSMLCDGESASLVRDEEVVQKMIDLDYRAYRQESPAMRTIIQKIAVIASQVTEGFPIEFIGIAEDKRGLFPEFQTPDGKVPLNVLSQGTQSLMQWVARLLIGYAEHYDFPESLQDKPGILIIDEIDAHLHPSWQRRIIPAITNEFPALQIFCSTHSPLMLAGLKAGQVHLLTRNEKGKVVVSRNETDIIGWSADEIITTFLGVENATDLQTEKDLERLRELRGKKRLTSKQRDELESLRTTVNRRLLSGPGVEDVDQLAERLKGPLGESPAKKTARKGRTTGKPSRRHKKKATSVSRRAKG